MKNIRTYAENCLRDESQALLDMIPQLDAQFDRAVDLIFHCKGHVVVTGVGKSGHVGAKIAATLASTGTPAVYISALDAMHGDMGMIMPDDLVFMLSNSGNTDELLRIVAALEQRRIPIVSMTGNADSLLARHSDVHILVHVDKEACPLNLAPTSSTTAQMAMGDALAITLMELRHFKAADFASFHPGGSIGRKLITRVKDVMYTENFPIISCDMLLVDALIDISRGKLGLGIVLDAQERVYGIITDGDIRRAVENRKQNFLSVKVSDVMTLNPKTIDPEAKLAQIQQMFRRHKIHSLLVVDDQHRLIGIVDYFAIMN
ncbi:MAG: KpsF/GutQ family sugar-phosphate isomerase [Bacteroidaceae bacterium]|nr:KpsF/GutQ family sugar-phosphate isomerase [Bacteroidaceae bacterium]MDO4995358.1 KpsF/GutQ family sugar-phosphate isomerase [Bacteroidales bacterium]